MDPQGVAKTEIHASLILFLHRRADMHFDPENDLDDDELEPLYHRDKSGHFTLTEKGIEQYRKRFARFGLRVEAIHTLEDFQNALALSQAGFIDELVEIAREGPPCLERRLLMAIIRGDEPTTRRLTALVEKRNRLGLSLIKGGAA
jgi:hypothetical protein